MTASIVLSSPSEKGAVRACISCTDGSAGGGCSGVSVSEFDVVWGMCVKSVISHNRILFLLGQARFKRFLQIPEEPLLLKPMM